MCAYAVCNVYKYACDVFAVDYAVDRQGRIWLSNFNKVFKGIITLRACTARSFSPPSSAATTTVEVIIIPIYVTR